MRPNITAELADEALKMALARRNPPEGCACHSDRGSRYVSLLLSKAMHDNGIRPSMGSISSPWDDAAMESLMGIVKSECVHARTYATREEAALDLFGYIGVVCNRARIHSALGYLSPVEFEKANWPDEKGRPMDWDNIMDTENRAFRLERCSNHARKTLRQAIQAPRREIGSRGRDPGQGAVRPAQRAVPHPQKVGGGIRGRRRGRVPRERQPRREQGLRDTEAQEGERGAPQGGRATKKFRAFLRQARA